MALVRPFGIDPDETWELDFVAEDARLTIDALRRAIASEREVLTREADEKKRAASEGKVAAAEKALAQVEADIAAYEPGTGPVFVVGLIPNAKRAEIHGDSIEVARLPEGKEAEIRDRAWSELVVRWGVRGHRNLLSGKSKQPKPIAFATETVDFAGEKRAVVARKTLEAYGPILGRLALLVLRSQQIDEAGKNG